MERRISECVRGLRGDEMLIQQGLYFASPLSWLASVFFRCLPALQSVLVQISINANGTSHDTCVQKIINNKIKQPESKPFWGWFMLRWTYYLRCRLKIISWYFIESCANDICYGVEENTEQGSVSDNISISMLLTSVRHFVEDRLFYGGPERSNILQLNGITRERANVGVSNWYHRWIY